MLPILLVHASGCLVACYPPACLLLACCLLAKPVTSTLDTREGYNAKTSSSSLVTLTRIEYWDQVMEEGTCSRRLKQQMRYKLDSGREQVKRGSK